MLDGLTIQQQLGFTPDQPPTPVDVDLKDMKVRTALRAILAQYGLSYAPIGDTVVVTTEDVAMVRQMRQRVNVDLIKVELARALRQLAHDTATNVIVDARAEKDAQAQVTMQLEDVPLETAVRLLSEMAGLKPVRVGNVLFVTKKEIANELRNDPDLVQPVQPGQPQPGVPPIGIGDRAESAAHDHGAAGRRPAGRGAGRRSGQDAPTLNRRPKKRRPMRRIRTSKKRRRPVGARQTLSEPEGASEPHPAAFGRGSGLVASRRQPLDPPRLRQRAGNSSRSCSRFGRPCQNSIASGRSRRPPQNGGRGTSFPSYCRASSSSRRSSVARSATGSLCRDAHAPSRLPSGRPWK